MNSAVARNRPDPGAGASPALCFVVDTDFGYLQGFSKSLRGLGVNTVEFVNSARLGERVENHNPAIVFINLNATDPYDCARALFSPEGMQVRRSRAAFWSMRTRVPRKLPQDRK